MSLGLAGDDLARSLSSQSFKNVWQQEPDIFRRGGEREEEEEAELRWAALERLPAYDRLRKGFLKKVLEDGTIKAHEIDVKKLSSEERRYFMNRILEDVERDNKRLLRGLKSRIDRVGLDLPKIEIRYEHLSVEGEVHVGSRALPSLINAAMNTIEFCP